MVDSDWATDKVDRRSTSAGVAQLGGCTIITYSRTQRSPAALSSAEAEGHPLGSGAYEGLFICAVAKELGVELKLTLHSDSTATLSQHTKLGLGRMKHVELRFLFVKDLLKRERLTLSKIPATENPADARNQYAGCEHSSTPVLDHEAVEEIKGNQREFAIHWKRWTTERVERSENIGSWIGAMSTRELDVHESFELRI